MSSDLTGKVYMPQSSYPLEVAYGFNESRAVNPNVLAPQYREALAPYFRRARRVLDLGGAVGHWGVAIASWYPQVEEVVVLDPSKEMQQVGAEKRPHKRIRRVVGTWLNLRRRPAYDVVWISDVWQIIHKPRAIIALPYSEKSVKRPPLEKRDPLVQQISAVLHVGGYVLVRTLLREALDSHYYNNVVKKYWPGAHRLLKSASASLYEMLDAFGEEFCVLGAIHVEHPTASSLSAYAYQLVRRANNSLYSLGDAEFIRGFEQLKAAASSSQGLAPVRDSYDVFVLQKQKLKSGGYTHSNSAEKCPAVPAMGENPYLRPLDGLFVPNRAEVRIYPHRDGAKAYAAALRQSPRAANLGTIPCACRLWELYTLYHLPIIERRR
jgi:SAM-dependent methyltransferase